MKDTAEMAELQSWTKVLGLIYICGAFSNAPYKQSRANSSPLGQPLPPRPHLQCWTRVQVISSEFQHCMGGRGGGGGRVKQRNLKRITVLFKTPFWKHTTLMQLLKCPKEFCPPLSDFHVLWENAQLR